MFFVKKFLLLLLFIASLTFSATEDSKKLFLQLYYSGKYFDAHAILNRANPPSKAVWEERLHLHEDIDCEFQSDESSRATALLRIGYFNQAKHRFGQDWLSFLGRAKLAGWSNDLAMARAYLSRAMKLSPNNPDLLFYSGLFADEKEESVYFFQQFLKSGSVDSLKRNSAKQTIEFTQKTKGLELNQSNLNAPVETIDSTFDNRKLTIRAKIDESKEVVLLMDTGAAGLSLKDKNWKARSMTDLMIIGLGARQKTKAALVVFDELKAGMFEIKNPVAAVSPSLQGAGIDGIAGSIIFSRYNIVLPMKNSFDVKLSTLDSDQLVEYVQHNGLPYKEKVTLPFYQVGKMIILKGTIKRSEPEMDILLDSGAQASILSAATARRYVFINYPKTFREKRKTRMVGIGGKIDNLIHAENVDIEIGPLRKSFNRMVAANLSQISEALELEIDLILGQDFLAGYTLVIDYKNNLITFLS